MNDMYYNEIIKVIIDEAMKEIKEDKYDYEIYVGCNDLRGKNDRRDVYDIILQENLELDKIVALIRAQLQSMSLLDIDVSYEHLDELEVYDEEDSMYDWYADNIMFIIKFIVPRIG